MLMWVCHQKATTALTMACSDNIKPESQVLEQHLHDLATSITDWKKFSCSMRMTEDDLSSCSERDDSEAAVRLLKKWSTRFADQATYQSLIDAARKSEEIKLASHVDKLLGRFGSSMSVEDQVKDFLKEHPEAFYINKEVFNSCFWKIKPWLDISTLYPFLMRFQLVRNAEDVECLTSPYFLPDMRMTSLLKLVESGGAHGYMLLYMSLFESASEVMGHSYAILQLTTIASKKCIKPPWEGEEPQPKNKDFQTPEICEEMSKMGEAISQLEDTFSQLHQSLLKDLSTNRVQVGTIMKKLRFFCSPLKVEDLSNERALEKLFRHLSLYIWNILDYHLLESIINDIGSKSLQEKMEKYVTSFREFQEATKLSHFTDCWSGRNQKPQDFIEVRTDVDFDHNVCTLKQLLEIQMVLHQRFFPDFSGNVMLYHKHNGSNSMTWIMPQELANRIPNETTAQSSFFQENNIISISVQPVLKVEVVTHQEFSSRSSITSTESGSSGVSLASSILSGLSQAIGPHCLHDVTPSIEFQSRLKRVKDMDKGSYPSITLNNHNIVVEVSHQYGTNSTFYRVGVLKEKDRIEWGDPSSNDPPMRIHYGSGTNPQVTLNAHNYVVEVHKGKCFDRCFYRLGKVNPETRTLEWVLNKYYDMGLFPKVALNDRNMVVTVFQDNLITKHLNYRIGQINAAGDEIDWQDCKQRIQGTNAEAFSLDMNNNGLVVLSYQNIVTNRIYCKVGQVMNSATGPTKLIDWSERSRICKGANPCASINNNDYVVQAYQSFHYKHLLSNVGVARWSSEFKGIEMTLSHEVSKEKNPKRRVARQHYGKGLHPSIALNDNNQVVEVHEPRVQRNRLHYYIGKLKIENN